MHNGEFIKLAEVVYNRTVSNAYLSNFYPEEIFSNMGEWAT